jgi:hypothetical protein
MLLALMAVFFAVGVAAAGGRDVIQAGFVLQQGYIPGEHLTN